MTKIMLPSLVRSTKPPLMSEMLEYRRPAGSKTERKFIKRFLRPLGVESDGYGNVYKRVGDAPVAWCCHTDTVHSQGGLQRVTWDNEGLYFLKNPKESSCLGADDTAGVWLMINMIMAERPGLYIFHRSEERGGQGSLFIAKDGALLDGIKIAIALDRRGTTDVITHQAGGRCCSKEFAESLAGAIGMKYKPSANGIFTDTANYTEIVPECTNLSVGYNGEHSSTEMLDGKHLKALLDRMLELDVSSLVVKRDPKEVEYDWTDRYYGGGWGRFRDYGSTTSGTSSQWSWDRRRNRYVETTYQRGKEVEYDEADELEQMTMEQIVETYPYEVADFLDHHGIGADDLVSYIKQCYGLGRK